MFLEILSFISFLSCSDNLELIKQYPRQIFFFPLITFLVDNVSILYGEITNGSQTESESSGLNNVSQNILHLFSDQAHNARSLKDFSVKNYKIVFTENMTKCPGQK